MNLRTLLVFACFTVAGTRCFSAPADTLQINCKIRLPDNINIPGIVIMPLLSPDGMQLYFDRKNHINNTGGLSDPDDIWVSRRLPGGLWSEPENVKALNTPNSDILLSISRDGRSALVFNGNLAEKGQGFAISHIQNGVWQEPVSLNIKDYYNYSGYYFGNLSADGRVLLFSLDRRDTRGNLDIYVSFLNAADSTWSAPLNIGSIVNTSAAEYSPFLAGDGKSLYFASNGHGGFGGFDLFVTRRLDNTWTSWSKPVNLGEAVNTPGGEHSITLNAAGDTLALISTDREHRREGIYFICLPKSLQPGKPQEIAIPEFAKTPAAGNPDNTVITVYFGRNDYRISPADSMKICALNGYNGKKSIHYIYDIAAYTCDIGSPEYNKNLAKRRADAVHTLMLNCILKSDKKQRRESFRPKINLAPAGKILSEEEREKARKVEVTIKQIGD